MKLSIFKILQLNFQILLFYHLDVNLLTV